MASKNLQTLTDQIKGFEAKLNNKADLSEIANLREEFTKLKESIGNPMPEESKTVKRPIAVVETTMGTFKFELYTDKAPKTAQNFIDLANKGFYNGLKFHRVAPGFVIQTGDPNGDGSGGPGYTIKLEIAPDLKHDSPGVVAMARSSDPDSAGSQFYITLGVASFLDGKYAIFGRVTDGLNVVKAIGSVPIDDSRGKDGHPLQDVKMTKVTIEPAK
ncbi:peptidylprolyl isomerase [Candidatus Acetothermia bacterium]|nr:peptidylprolyl isomerase [Candidatus Acetothermia bacterium]